MVWKLSEAILAVKPNLFLPKANEDIRSESILVRSRVICAYALTGDEKKIKVAQKLYRNMISSDSAKDRLWATKILYCSPQVEDSPSSLSKKFKDSDLQVVLSLARAARKIYDEKIIDVMLDGLAKPELRYSFSKTLLNIGIACREQLLNKIENTEKNSLVRHLVYLLASFEQPKIEKDLINLSLSPNITLSSIAIYNLAYRTRKWPLSEDSKNSVSYLIDKTISFSQILMQERSRTSSQFMLIEINSRLTMLKQNYLYLLSVYFKSEVILELSPTLLKPKQYKNLQARALELLETCVNEPDLKVSITIVLEEEIIPKYNASKGLNLIDLDPWFKTLSLYSNKMLKGKLMDTISKVLILRKLSIFEELSPEAIQSVAENLETQEIIAGEEVFSEGDYADGLYIVSRGSFELIKDGRQIAKCVAPDFFGELALLDDEPRYASAVANTDAELYFMDKITFSRLVDEQPAILKELTKLVIKYYRELGSLNSPHFSTRHHE